MSRGTLSQHFVGTGSKRLSAVEAEPTRSNQHELNGVAALRQLLGDARRKLDTTFLYLNDDTPEPLVAEGTLTWYDAREKHKTRSEYRLYFPDNDVMRLARAGSTLILALRPDGSILAIVTDEGSTTERQLQWLFDLPSVTDRLLIVPEADYRHRPVDFVKGAVLDQIGIEQEEPDEVVLLDAILTEFGARFPTTRDFSRFAREHGRGPDPRSDPDGALLGWFEHETRLFRVLERRIVEERIKGGFDNVEEFLSVSLSIQNRRKSRAGQALENHVEALFVAHSLRYSRGAVTENRCRPDFVLPSIDHYHDPAFPSDRLTVLGAKSTCKDRWRQVLSEAKRVERKHLLTLEPAISEQQSEEMRAHGLGLVLPSPLFGTFTESQRRWLLSVSAFIDLARARQDASA